MYIWKSWLKLIGIIDLEYVVYQKHTRLQHRSSTDPVLLDRDVRQMHEHVVQFVHIGIVFDGAEATESQAIPSDVIIHKQANQMHFTT